MSFQCLANPCCNNRSEEHGDFALPVYGAYHDLIMPVREIAEQASRAIMQVYSEPFEVVRKPDYSPVTAADVAAHDIIVEALERLTPGVPILSEEADVLPFAQRRTWDRYWLVDPLDGTREFIKRNGEFTVNIALIVGHEAVLGVIAVPATSTCYYATQTRGAFKQLHGAESQPIRVRRWDGNRIVVAGSRSHGSERFEAFLRRFSSSEVLRVGSSLKSCLVAEGNADIYVRFGPTSEWDTAAAQVIVEQAGGAVFDLQMQPLRYNTKDSILNPAFVVVGDTSHDWPHYLALE